MTVVLGETGSGKSSKLPELLYKSGVDSIALTLPRRVSVLNIAARIASNNPQFPGLVGHSVRFDKSASQGAITVLTDGMLL